MNNETMSLNEKLAVIQTEFKAKKSRFNSFGKYNFTRGFINLIKRLLQFSCPIQTNYYFIFHSKLIQILNQFHYMLILFQ
jgi:hypothetical protein